MSRFFIRLHTFVSVLVWSCGGFVVFAFLFAPQTRAANGNINQQVSYQAKLTDSSGSVVTDGNYAMKFSVYDASTGGNRLWTATGTIASPGAINASSTSGLFTINFGDTSAAGQWQNALPTNIWHNDSLFLGVTIGADAEMTPRRRLTAAPQAFNALQLQGMSASGTAYGVQSLFTVHQTETSAATGTRAALLVQSRGTSPTNDFLIRGANSAGAGVFSVDIAGGISTSGTVTSTGRMAALADLFVGTSTYAGGLHALFSMNGDDLLVGGNIGAASSVYSNGAFIAGSGSTWFGNGYINQNNGNLTLQASGGYILPASDLGVSFGSNALRYNGYFGATTSTSATTTNLSATNSVLTNTTSTAGYFSTLHGLNTSSTNATATTMTLTSSLNNVVSGNTLFVTASSVSTGDGPVDVAVAGKYAYVVLQNDNRLSIYDITDPASPSSTGSVAVGATPVRLAVEGRYAYVANNANPTVSIVDISSPANPRVVNTVGGMGGGSQDIAVNGGYVYVTNDAGNSLVVIDARQPEQARKIHSVNVGVGTNGLTVQGKFAYVVSQLGQSLHVFDLQDPSNPTLVTTKQIGGGIWDIAVQGRYAYLTNNEQATAVRIYDISDPSAPRFVVTRATSDLNVPSTYGVMVAGRYLYFPGSLGLAVFDIQDPTNPAHAKSHALGATGYGVALSGRYALTSIFSQDKLMVVDIGGAETVSIKSSSVEAGYLQVLSDGRIANKLIVEGGIMVGRGGVAADGPMNVYATNTTSTFFGSFVIDTSSTIPGAEFINSAPTSVNTSWGAYIDSLLVGDAIAATGTANYAAVIAYSSSSGFGGLCLRDSSSSVTCPTANINGASILADGAVNANAFDLAERYAITGVAQTGDVLVMDETASSTVKKSTGIPYDSRIIGVVSDRPGFLLGWGGGTAVALTGRVPVKFSPMNGPLRVGDPLTSSPMPGMAMKATKPGRILGYALEASSGTSTVDLFVKVGYEAGMALNTDGTVTRMTDDILVAPRSVASAAEPMQDSWGFTFRGSAWDGTQAVHADFTLLNDLLTSTSSRFTIRNTLSSGIFSVDQNGTARISGDLVVGGRLFPSASGLPQDETYLFVDRVSSPSSTYIATNADGWQANASYDFAERYYSPDALEPGDLVVASHNGRVHVQRAWDERTALIGIVSTRPGFVAGAPATSTFPIALAGRVPTKVSTVKGAIHAGDFLAPSTIPGVAVRATAAGPIVGQALETYDAAEIGKIEVFVNPSWWGGEEKIVTPTVPALASTITPLILPTVQRGIALVTSGSKQVRISFPSLLAFPSVQTTPRGEVDGGWWTDGYSDTGFEIRLKQAQTHDVIFMWSAEPMQDNERAFVSDGTTADVHPQTGEIFTHMPAVIAISTTTETTLEIVTTTAMTVMAPVEDIADTVTSTPVEITTEPAAASSTDFVDANMTTERLLP